MRHFCPYNSPLYPHTEHVHTSLCYLLTNVFPKTSHTAIDATMQQFPTTTIFFRPLERLCEEAACLLHICVDFHSPLSMSRCLGNPIVHVCEEQTLLSDICCKYFVVVVTVSCIMNETNKSHQNL